MKIAGRNVGPLDPCFIVAELGLNHNGSLGIAHNLIETAAGCKADAVKLQKREPTACLTASALAAPYTGQHSFGSTYGEHRAALELNADQWTELKRHAEALGLIFFGSAFDVPSLLFLMQIGVPAIKIPSCDLNHRNLLMVARETEIPLIVSTGMATEPEIDRAMDTLAPARAARRLTLMHCVSGYPVDNADANLRRIQWLHRYGVPCGYSGHERGIAISVAAVVLGAVMVERHFTLDRAAKGPDHAASLEPEGLRRLVRDIRKVEAGLGFAAREQPFPCEMASKKKLRKSAVAAKPLPGGHLLSTGDIAWKAPEVEGAAPPDQDIRGRILAWGVEADEPLMLTNLLRPIQGG